MHREGSAGRGGERVAGPGPTSNQRARRDCRGDRMKKSLLINWVYYLPAGHLVEAIRNAYAYHVVNKDRVEISLLANAQTPVELARGCPWISRVYEVSLAEVCEKREQASCLQAIP